MVKAAAGVNYAIWRGDSGDDGCYVCDLRDRGMNPGDWPLGPMKGAVSFLGTGVLPPLPPPPKPPNFPDGVPVRVVRTYETAAAAAGNNKNNNNNNNDDDDDDGGDDDDGFILRFNITNTHAQAVEIGGLGLPMPSADMCVGVGWR